MTALEEAAGASSRSDLMPEDDADSKPVGGVIHKLPDVATGRGMRRSVTLPRRLPLSHPPLVEAG